MVFWVLSAMFGAWLGGQRNRAAEGFFLGLALGPLGWIIALLLPTRTQPKWKLGRCSAAATREQRAVSNWLDGVTQPEQQATARTFPRPVPVDNGLPKPRAVAAFACPHCQASVADDRSLAGQLVACPSCGRMFRMP
jgi:hypothetical protein